MLQVSLESKKSAPSVPARAISPPALQHLEPPGLGLQRAIGNQGLARLLQAKPSVSEPKCVYDHDGDRVANLIKRSATVPEKSAAEVHHEPQLKCITHGISELARPERGGEYATLVPRSTGPAGHESANDLSGVLQCRCTCGDSTDAGCAECKRKRKDGTKGAVTIALAPIQTKLSVSEPSDPFEQEADQVADQIMRMPGAMAPTPERLSIASEPEETAWRHHCKCDIGETFTHNTVETVLHEPSQPLDPATRDFFECRFSHDLSQVRVHSDSRANESAAALGAHAYTVGSDIVFAAGRHDPTSAVGRRLLAHELVHVVQQGHAPSMENYGRAETPSNESSFRNVAADGMSAEPIKLGLSAFRRESRKVARDKNPSATSQSTNVGYVAIYFGSEDFIDFHTENGLFRYHIDEHSDLAPGEYAADVAVKGKDVTFTLDLAAGQLFEFSYRVEPGKPNPATFFAHQNKVTFTVVAEDAPELSPSKDSSEDDRDPRVKYLTPEEAMRRCESGDLPGVKIFPFRGTRFGGAPISAHRDGDDIIVKSYVYVLGNEDFKAQTRTLPYETFIGGVRLKPNEIVRVHTYEPRWYQLNITGSTSGDIENEFCVTGEQMLEIAHRSDIAVGLNIGLTVLDAATLFIPVGKIAGVVGRPIVQLAARSGRSLVLAALLGLREAAPTAFAGIASRTSTVVLEEQLVDQAASRAISSSASHAVITFSEEAAAPALPRAIGEAAVEKGTSAGVSALSRTAKVTVVDAAGHQVISSITTPTGDAALDQMIDEAFSQTFDMTQSAAAQVAGQGITTVAPEIAAGFSEAEVKAFGRILGKRFSTSDINILEQLWDDAARAGDSAILNAGNSRYLFDLHRNRFWSRVASNPQARTLFEDAGCKFSGGAPYYVLNGRRITITIDHIIERQSAPNLALTASNLQLSFSRENSIVLRLLNQLGAFQ